MAFITREDTETPLLPDLGGQNHATHDRGDPAPCDGRELRSNRGNQLSLLNLQIPDEAPEPWTEQAVMGPGRCSGGACLQMSANSPAGEDRRDGSARLPCLSEKLSHTVKGAGDDGTADCGECVPHAQMSDCSAYGSHGFFRFPGKVLVSPHFTENLEKIKCPSSSGKSAYERQAWPCWRGGVGRWGWP